MGHVWRCLDEGAGVLVYTNLTDLGGPLRGGWNEEMARWGIQIRQSCILDPSSSFGEWQAYGRNSYSWTENLASHPVTEGLRRVYYVSANLRWDDCFTAPPLLCDAIWPPIVAALPGSAPARLVDREWVREPEWEDVPVLAAVRTAGKGRLGVVTINPGTTIASDTGSSPRSRTGR